MRTLERRLSALEGGGGQFLVTIGPEGFDADAAVTAAGFDPTVPGTTVVINKPGPCAVTVRDCGRIA